MVTAAGPIDPGSRSAGLGGAAHLNWELLLALLPCVLGLWGGMGHYC